jgi:hypothetical protein
MKRKSLLAKLAARFRNNPFFGKAMHVFGQNIPDNKKWIIILGSYNSGTTLLGDILSAHPSISALPDEGVMLSTVLPRPEDHHWRRMWWKCEKEMSLPADDAARASKLKRQWSHFLDLEKPFLMEKSIANTCRLLFFEKQFGSPYFIHIVRNGYAVAEGIHRKATMMNKNPLWPARNYPMAYCINQWKRSLQVVEQHKQALSHFKEIRYEELTNNPEKTLAELTSFLGLAQLDAAMLKSSFQVHEKNSAIVNMNEASIQRLQSNDIKEINRVAADVLMKYNYPIINP